MALKKTLLYFSATALKDASTANVNNPDKVIADLASTVNTYVSAPLAYFNAAILGIVTFIIGFVMHEHNMHIPKLAVDILTIGWDIPKLTLANLGFGSIVIAILVIGLGFMLIAFMPFMWMMTVTNFRINFRKAEDTFNAILKLIGLVIIGGIFLYFITYIFGFIMTGFIFFFSNIGLSFFGVLSFFTLFINTLIMIKCLINSMIY
jgi:hypothetical protein